MLFFARLFANEEQAAAAAAALVEVGYAEDSVAMLTSEAGADAGAEEGGEPAAGADREMAVRAGKFMGDHAEFYVSQVRDGVCLVVSAPPFMASARAEQILDAHDPLPISHLPPRKPFVPVSEQATPFSDMMGWPTLSKSDTPFSSAFGFGFKQDGLSHFSRWFRPLAHDYTLSGTLGWKTTASKDTFFKASTKSDRLEGKNSSFGMGFKTKYDLPFSTMLGLPVLSNKKFYLTGYDQ